jgi:hypothetical protein
MFMTPLCSSAPINARLQLLRRRRSIVPYWIIDPKTNLSSSQFPDGNAKLKFHRTMSNEASRAATAAISRDVKQKLVKLLFRENTYSRTGCSKRNEHLNLSGYSYEDLRRAYLKRLQVIHPDKINANSSIDMNRRQSFKNQQYEKNNVDPLHSKEELKREFQELQSTWDRYEELSKSMMKVIQGDGATANFTKFGVGCSFSDNEEEKALRNEITDQACRGWFSSGLVSSGLSTENDGNRERDGQSSKQKSLIDDSMFVQAELCDKYENLGSSRQETKKNRSRRNKRTLIPGIN